MLPKLLKWPKKKIAVAVNKLIELAQLPKSYLDRYPNELSGGQQQRVGVIRALAANQNLILMDEPFGALDPITRESLQTLVKNLQSKLGKTIVFVTHDMDEALKLATKIVVLHGGHLIQVGSPDEILHYPKNKFVENLIGEKRLSEAKYETVKVKNVMLTDPVKINQTASLTTALAMMKEHRVDTLLVVDFENHFKGYISINELQKKYNQANKISEILLTKIPVLRPDEYLRDNFSRILSRAGQYIPVVDDNERLVGIVTRSSLVNVIYEKIWGDKTALIKKSEKEVK
ncbi:CBS domain-containing protein [Lactobacillus bombicola]|uniref:CBS domain-containing protein n=1 Tax=Lactobacillus bombicola TaxID=1505723 RepID=UPI0026CF9494|nr:CBS domain-containing protein [Lactobacillus bombicola]